MWVPHQINLFPPLAGNISGMFMSVLGHMEYDKIRTTQLCASLNPSIIREIMHVRELHCDQFPEHSSLQVRDCEAGGTLVRKRINIL